MPSTYFNSSSNHTYVISSEDDPLEFGQNALIKPSASGAWSITVEAGAKTHHGLVEGGNAAQG